MTEQEMMQDLAAADAAGDSQLAQHIADKIKTSRAPAAPPDTHGILAKGAHYGAKALPAVGGVVGGVLSGVGGAPSGPGAILTSALGAGLGAASGRGLQHFIDERLGYEKPMGMVDAVKDTVSTGAKDALLTAGTGMALSSAAAAAPVVADALRGGAIATGRRILRNVGGSISASKPLSGEAVQEALDSGVFKFGGTSKGATHRLDALREQVGNEYGGIVAKLEANGVTGPETQSLAQKYLVAGRAKNATTMNPSVPSIYETAADQVATKLPSGGRLGLVQSEELKRSAQGMARSAYKKMDPTEVGDAHKEVASILRQSVEDEIAQQTANASPDVQALAAQFGPVKDRLGKLIQAGDVADVGLARAQNRNKLSLWDAAAATGAFAHHGSPLEAGASALAMHLLREHGPSTAAVSMKFGADALDALAPKLAEQIPAVVAGTTAAERQHILALIEGLRKQSPVAPALQTADASQ